MGPDKAITERLAEIGRNTVRMQIHASRQRARERRIVDAVNRHLRASANELQERLLEIDRSIEHEISEDDIVARLNGI